MPSTETRALGEVERRRLLDLAWASIRHGLESGSPTRPDLDGLRGRLLEPCASFVTLHRLGVLRGCVGHLESIQPLALDVADNAFAAAFRDPRFQPLVAQELKGLDLSISILSSPTPMAFEDEPDLLRQLCPGKDGLILDDRGRRATFLPAVWETLPEPGLFLDELKRKAGLPASHWSPSIRVFCYRTESFGG